MREESIVIGSYENMTCIGSASLALVSPASARVCLSKSMLEGCESRHVLYQMRLVGMLQNSSCVRFKEETSRAINFRVTTHSRGMYSKIRQHPLQNWKTKLETN